MVPAALRKLIKLTGTDLRTKSGLARMDDLLQRKQTPALPRSLTDAIMSKHGIANGASRAAGQARSRVAHEPERA